MRDILHDGDLFMNSTIDEIEDVVNGIVCTAEGEIQKINENFAVFVDRLLEDIQFNNLTSRVDDIVGLLDSQKRILEDVNDVIGVQSSIVELLTDLEIECREIIPIIDSAQCDILTTISLQLDGLPIESIPPPDENLAGNLENLMDIFDDVTHQIENIDISDILSQLSDEVNSISDNFSEELSSIDDIQEKIFRNDNIPTNMEELYDNYLKHINTGFLIVSGFLALILTFVLIGLICGVSQKSSHCGSRSLCSSLSVFFIASVFLFLICMALFVVGAITQKLVCDTFNDPESSEAAPLLDLFLNDAFNDAVNLNDAFNLSVSVIISGIHQGLPVYPLLQLRNLYDINNLVNWKEDFNISSIIDSTMGSIDDVISDVTDRESQITANEDEIVDLVRNLDSTINPILDSLLDPSQINEPIKESRDLLDSIIDGIPSVPEVADFTNGLAKLSSEVGHLEENITNVQNDFRVILETFGDGDGERLDLESYVETTFFIVGEAFDIFPTEVETFINGTIDDLIGAVDDEVPGIIDAVKTVGKTLPLSNIFNSTYTHMCLELVSPLNSGWNA